MFGPTFRSSRLGPHSVCLLCSRRAFSRSESIIQPALRCQSTLTPVAQEHEFDRDDKPSVLAQDITNLASGEDPQKGVTDPQQPLESRKPTATNIHTVKANETDKTLTEDSSNTSTQSPEDKESRTDGVKLGTASSNAQPKSRRRMGSSKKTARSTLVSNNLAKNSGSQALSTGPTTKTKRINPKTNERDLVVRHTQFTTRKNAVPMPSVKEDLAQTLRDMVRIQGKMMSKRTLMELLQNGSLTDAGRKDAMRRLRESLVTKGVPDVESVLETASARAPILETQHPKVESRSHNSIKEAMQRTSTRGVRGTKDRVDPEQAKKIEPIKRRHDFKDYEMKTVNAGDLKLKPHDVPQAPVPTLAYGLERALFNPGVYQLRDPRSRVFNFDPYLQTIMPVAEFDFNALKEYITSSRDETLIGTAAKLKKKYTGSTSSMTSALSHFHYILSNWRDINISNLSKGFPDDLLSFTGLQRSPTAIFLRWKDGLYAIDADKQYDTPNILSMLGKSMEKLLTLPPEDYERYRKENSHQISEEERDEVESFHYTTMGDFLMRSQLDAHDPRLPGTGMFDLKTRAVVSIRMDARNYEQGLGYEILGRHGEYHSFEREYYDMVRSAFLKYSLQVRMGRMDGIFVAFHNTERIFGFQYISLNEMDLALHGTEDTTMGDMEFKLSLELLNRVLDRATAKYPKQSLRIHFEARESTGKSSSPFLYIFATPVRDEEIDEIQSSNKSEIEGFEKRVLGLHGGASEEEMKLDEAKAEKEEAKASWEALQAQVEEEIDNDEGDEVTHEEEEISTAVQDTNAIKTLSAIQDVEDQQYISATGTETADSEKPLAELLVAVNSIQNSVTESSGKIIGNDVDSEVPKSNNQGQSALLTTAADGQDILGGKASEKEEESTSNHEKKEGEAHLAASEENSPVDPNTDKPLPVAGKDLLAMYLTVRNKVNGKYVERPEELTAADKWELEYALAEIPDPKGTTLYKSTLSRRKNVMLSGKANQLSDFRRVYFEKIGRLVKESKEFRQQQDKMDRSEPLKVFSTADTLAGRERGDIR